MSDCDKKLYIDSSAIQNISSCCATAISDKGPSIFREPLTSMGRSSLEHLSLDRISRCVFKDYLTGKKIVGRVTSMEVKHGGPTYIPEYRIEMVQERIIDWKEERDEKELAGPKLKFTEKKFDVPSAPQYINLDVERVIFNDPATIVFWGDGSKTVVKCTKGQKFNKYYGFCAAVTKHIFENNSQVNKLVNSGFEEGVKILDSKPLNDKKSKKSSKKGKKS